MTSVQLDFDPNLADENRGQAILVICITFSVLIILSTTSRIVIRSMSEVGLRAADYFIMIVLALNLAGNMMLVQCVRRGLGRHLQFLTEDQGQYVQRMSQDAVTLSTISVWAVKMSVCFFLLALIEKAHRRARWIVFALMAFMTVGSVCQCLIWGLQARPLIKLGKLETAESWKFNVLLGVFATLNSTTDLFYSLSPIYFFGRLQMDLRKKLTILALTGSGLIVFAFSVARVGFSRDFVNPDSTWALLPLEICNITERNLAEIVADLPASYSFFRDLGRRVQTMLSRRSMRSSQGSGSTVQAGKPTRRQPPCSDTESSAEEDIMPLESSSYFSSKDGAIHLLTSIDIESRSVDTKEER
ncbi:hypothetical protein CP533_3626 [Ophiocordyceps camponoti-saundersi (nom. inval.)]|nr:hypothetical protein CP533_3626 [Ophiocordyceps camponoti-saundersi (nom. inval.)]